MAGPLPPQKTQTEHPSSLGSVDGAQPAPSVTLHSLGKGRRQRREQTDALESWYAFHRFPLGSVFHDNSGEKRKEMNKTQSSSLCMQQVGRAPLFSGPSHENTVHVAFCLIKHRVEGNLTRSGLVSSETRARCVHLKSWGWTPLIWGPEAEPSAGVFILCSLVLHREEDETVC